MSHATASFLHWAPRVLGLLFAVFLGMFALDVFGEGYSLGQLIVALGMHLIPSALVLTALGIACRYESVGGWLFVGLGLWYVLGMWGRFPWSVYVLIAGPAFLIGLLFELDAWIGGRRDRSSLA